jgi:hypothetical protein
MEVSITPSMNITQQQIRMTTTARLEAAGLRLASMADQPDLFLLKAHLP